MVSRNAIVHENNLVQVPVHRAQHLVCHSSQQPEDRVLVVPRVGRGRVASGWCFSCREGRRRRQTSVAFLHCAVRATDVEIWAMKRFFSTQQRGVRRRFPRIAEDGYLAGSRS